MALFHSPFDLFSNIHDLGHMHRRRRRSPVHHHHHNHGGTFTRHHLDPLFRFLVDDGSYDDLMDTTTTTSNKNKNNTTNAEEVVLFQPEVVENDFGHLISARVPGVSAKDIVVNVTPDGVLTVRCATHPHVKADMRLPHDWKHAYNVADVAASCIDGVLLIALPKMTPTSTAIVVSEPPAQDAAAAAADDDKMEEDDAQTQTIVLQVPGFSREDITVTRKRPAEQLLVTGKSSSRRRLVSGRAGGDDSRVVFRREFKLSDPDAAVTATCADGLLTIRVVAPTPIAPFSVPVSADRMLPPPTSSTATDDDAENNNEDDAAALKKEDEGKKITVMRRAVPGATAAGFKVEVTFGNRREGKMILTADADCTVAGLGRRRFHFATSLPEGLDHSTLRANVVEGLLTVTAAAPAAPAPVAVHVSGDTPAALPLPLPRAPTPAAAATITAAAATTVEDHAAAAADMEADDQ